jgi:TOBE domain
VAEFELGRNLPWHLHQSAWIFSYSYFNWLDQTPIDEANVALGTRGDGARLLSRMTLKSWSELALAEGQSVYAQVKYVSLKMRP